MKEPQSPGTCQPRHLPSPAEAGSELSPPGTGLPSPPRPFNRRPRALANPPASQRSAAAGERAAGRCRLRRLALHLPAARPAALTLPRSPSVEAGASGRRRRCAAPGETSPLFLLRMSPCRLGLLHLSSAAARAAGPRQPAWRGGEGKGPAALPQAPSGRGLAP